MTASMYFALMATVFVSPRLGDTSANILGILCIILSSICLFIGV